MTIQAYIFLSLWVGTGVIVMFQIGTIKVQEATIHRHEARITELLPEEEVTFEVIEQPRDEEFMTNEEIEAWTDTRTRDGEGWRKP